MSSRSNHLRAGGSSRDAGASPTTQNATPHSTHAQASCIPAGGLIPKRKKFHPKATKSSDHISIPELRPHPLDAAAELTPQNANRPTMESGSSTAQFGAGWVMAYGPPLATKPPETSMIAAMPS